MLQSSTFTFLWFAIGVSHTPLIRRERLDVFASPRRVLVRVPERVRSCARVYFHGGATAYNLCDTRPLSQRFAAEDCRFDRQVRWLRRLSVAHLEMDKQVSVACVCGMMDWLAPRLSEWFSLARHGDGRLWAEEKRGKRGRRKREAGKDDDIR